jgi:FkbM family methyltransferase
MTSDVMGCRFCLNFIHHFDVNEDDRLSKKFIKFIDMFNINNLKATLYLSLGLLAFVIFCFPVAKLVETTVQQSIAYQHSKRLDQCLDESINSTLQSNLKKYTDDGHNELLFSSVQLSSKSLLFDVGEYKGETLDRFNQASPLMYLYEPVPKYAKELEKKFPYAFVGNFGLGPKEKEAYIEVHDGWGEASHLVDHPNDATITVKIRLIDSLIADMGPSFIDLFIVNCEGCEYYVLQELIKTGVIKRIKVVMIQFHKNNPTSYIERCTLLSTLSYTHTATYSLPWIWDIWKLNEQIY